MSRNRHRGDEPKALEKRDFYDILNDDSCREILWMLADGPLSVSVLARRVGISPSETSKTLGYLHDFDVVAVDQDKTWHFYRLSERVTVVAAAQTRRMTITTARGDYYFGEPVTPRVTVRPASLLNQQHPAASPTSPPIPPPADRS